MNKDQCWPCVCVIHVYLLAFVKAGLFHWKRCLWLLQKCELRHKPGDWEMKVPMWGRCLAPFCLPLSLSLCLSSIIPSSLHLFLLLFLPASPLDDVAFRVRVGAGRFWQTMWTVKAACSNKGSLRLSCSIHRLKTMIHFVSIGKASWL